MTDVRARLLAPTAELAGENEVRVDFGGFIRRLVLFETYTLDSHQLMEFPQFVAKFGHDGVVALLRSGRLQIHCEPLNFLLIHRNGVPRDLNDSRDLPFGSYAIGMLHADLDAYRHDRLQQIHDIPEVTKKDAIKLKGEIAARIGSVPDDSGHVATDGLVSDLTRNVPTIAASTAIVLSQELGKQVAPDSFSLQVQHKDESTWRAETNIGQVFDLGEQTVHHIVGRGLLGVGGLNLRLELMRRYEAVAGFREGELPLFEQRLSFLARELDPEVQEERFNRVVGLAELPDVSDATSDHDVDLPALLELLNDEECQEFRHWLRTVDSASDNEIEDQFRSVREALGKAVHSKKGKAVRLAVSTGLGAIPVVGMAAGLVGGAADSFLLDKLVPEPGPTAFLSRLYDSVFE